METELRAHFLGGPQELRSATRVGASEYTVIASTRVLRDFLLDGTLSKVGRALGRHALFKTPANRDPMGRSSGTVFEFSTADLDSRNRPEGLVMEEVTMDRFSGGSG